MSDKVEATTGRGEIALLACIFVGLAVSALLFGEYQTGGLVCSGDSGCDVVRTSSYSSIAGISLPVLGIVYFLALLATAVLPAMRGMLVPLAAVGAVAGVVFITLQAVAIGAFCSLCLVVDFAAIGAGVTAFWKGAGAAPALAGNRAVTIAGLTVAALAMAGVSPLLAPSAPAVFEQAPGQVPGGVAAEQQAAGPVTVVEFIDFECPACRMQHQVFQEAMADYSGEVRLVYMHAPLSIHENADHSARVYICLEETEHSKAVADFLFTTPDLSLPAVEAFVQEQGVDLEELRACMASDATEERLARDNRLGNQSGVRSLPTFWIGQQKFVGVSDAATVRRSLLRWSQAGTE